MDPSGATMRGPQKVQNLGRYWLVAQLASGGMGVVYLALVRGPAGFNKPFVVKELREHLAEDPQFVQMFLEEARLAGKLNHPNVVQTIEVDHEGNRIFIAMEYLEGQPLHRILDHVKRTTGEPLKLEYVLQIIVQALEGLRYAHERTDFDGTRLGIVHRDISPHNIFVTYDGVVKVVDFGIAKALDSSQHTGTGILKGKVAFMAPEIVQGNKADQRADVFSTGVILWEGVTGRRLWKDKRNDMGILSALMAGIIPNVREARPEIPEELARIVDRSVAADPEARYPNVAEMQADIEAFLKRPGMEYVSPRDIGRLLSELFADERAKIQMLIDGHLKMLRGLESAQYEQVELAMLPTSQPSLGATPSGISLADLAALKSLSTVDTGSGRIVTGSGPPTGSGPIPTGSGRIVTGSGLIPTGSGAIQNNTGSAPAIPIAAPAARSKALFVIPAVGIAIGLALGAVVLHFGAAHAVPQPSPSTSVQAPVATPSINAATTVQLTVNATPPSARVSVDDGPLVATPFVGAFPNDGAAHSVRIEAPGFEPKSMPFTASADRSFDVALQAAAGPKHGGAQPSGAGHSSTATPQNPQIGKPNPY